ncbi:MAG: PAS domain-containing protein, partial [Actinomycetota bacterium]|nr:PAS domain-containing protein [Actinomycetota bacterium]
MRLWGLLGVAACLALLCGLLLRRRTVGAIARTRAAVEELAAGLLSARADEAGPAGVADLAVSLNRMADALEARILKASEASRLQDLILSSMEEGIMLVAPDGRITFANSASERHLGSVPGSASALTPVALRSAVTRARDDGSAVSIDADVGTPARALRGVATAVAADGSVLV